MSHESSAVRSVSWVYGSAITPVGREGGEARGGASVRSEGGQHARGTHEARRAAVPQARQAGQRAGDGWLPSPTLLALLRGSTGLETGSNPCLLIREPMI
mgnify:CR=1 FL=1